MPTTSHADHALDNDHRFHPEHVTNHLRYGLVAVAVGGLLAGSAFGGGTSASAAQSQSVGVRAADPAPSHGVPQQTDRAQAQSLFYDRLLPLTEVPGGWTGSVKNCNPGIISPAMLDASQKTINLFREMQGLQPVTLDPEYNAKAQAAALMMTAQKALSHHPDRSWACYTAAGAEGASHSNLYLGRTGADAIWGYMTDPGANNTAVGHRRWIINPPTTRMGVGMTDKAHALWTVGGWPAGRWENGRYTHPGTESAPEWMAWPSAGYFPVQLEPEGRWSLSASDDATDFRSATVQMRGPDGPVKLRVNPTHDGYGPNTLVWEANGLPDSVDMAKDATYQITVDGITRNGASLPAVSYPVTLVPPKNVPVPNKPVLAGRNEPGGTLSVRVPGLIKDASVSVVWLRDGKTVSRDDTYEVTRSDLGKRLTARVSVMQYHYKPTTVDTAAVRISGPRVRAATQPALRGQARVGGSLRVRAGAWSPKPTTVTYQWYRGSTAIRGATKNTYKPTKADRGKHVKAVVTARRAGYAAGTASAPAIRVR